MKININEETITSIIKKHKGDKKTMFKLIKAKLCPTYALFGLFTDEYKTSLTNLEKTIQKTSRKIEEKSNWKFVDRDSFVKKYDDDENVCRVHRICIDFLPSSGASLGGTPLHVKREIGFYNWYWFKLQKLGTNIIDQQLLMWDAINFGLKDPRDRELAISLAEQLKMIEVDKEENKLKIR